MREAARKLGDLKDRRTQADYEMDAAAVEEPKSAAFDVEIAKRLNANLRSILNGPDRPKILAEIANDREKIGDT